MTEKKNINPEEEVDYSAEEEFLAEQEKEEK